MRGQTTAQGWFQMFLRRLHRAYPSPAVWLVLDRGRARTAALAAELGIRFLWLPEQWSEMTAMDHVWKELDRNIAPNRRYRTVDDLADWAGRYIMGLTGKQALTKAGILSGHFWLGDLCENFCKPT